MLVQVRFRFPRSTSTSGTSVKRYRVRFYLSFIPFNKKKADYSFVFSINELCNPNVTNDLPPLKTSQSTWESRQAINAYGNRFAELLRKRWRAGSCGEDILILIVKHAPEVVL